MSKLILKSAVVALALSVFVPTLAKAATNVAATPVSTTHSQWQPVANANGVYVSFRRESRSVCTWLIRNNGSSTLRQLEFSYTYTPSSQTGEQTVGRDLLMSPLKRGELTGGATQFTAETPSCPTSLVASRIEWSR